MDAGHKFNTFCPQEVTTRGHYNLSLPTAFRINPHYQSKETHKTYFTTIKKHNTFYMRVFYRGSDKNESATVSLRTNNRREAKMNSSYLKDRLLEQAGSYRDFSQMKEALKQIAKNELLSHSKQPWRYYLANILYAQEAQQEAQTVEQIKYLQHYMGIMEKGLKSDISGLINIIDTTYGQESSQPATNTAQAKPTTTAITFPQIIEDYIKDKASNSDWTPATQGAKAPTLRKLVSYFKDCSLQDKPIDQLTRDDLLSVRDALCNAGLKLSTVNGQLADIKSVFSFAEMFGHIPKNPAIKLTLKDRDNKEPKALSELEVNAVLRYFRADYFTETKRSKRVIDSMKYIKWIPQIAAITGARLNEILQLRKKDIRQSENGLCWFIDINNKGDNVIKNKASARLVPLVDGAYGFDLKLFLSEAVHSCKDDSDNVFRLKNSDRKANTAKIARLLQAYKNTHSDAPSTLKMHSFRHTLSTLCLNKKIPESFTKEILGHTQSITYGLYGSAGVDVETMYKEMVTLWS